MQWGEQGKVTGLGSVGLQSLVGKTASNNHQNKCKLITMITLRKEKAF